MKNEIEIYKKALKRNLHCTGKTKRELLRRFDVSLEALLEDCPAPSANDLHMAFGPPEEMARVLMERVPEKEIMRYRRKQTAIKIGGVFLIAVLIAYTIYLCFFKEYNLVVDGEIIEGTTSSISEEE